MSQNPMPALRSKARHYAMQALYQWQMTKMPLNTIEAEYRTDNDMSKVDVDYLHELIHNVPANISIIETDFLPHLTDITLEQIDPISLAILRLSCYELRFRLDVPYKVVINEGLNLAKRFGATDSHKFINGVLDKVAPRVREAEVKAQGRRN
ncbi:transcription antitermination factor NusB [Marinagarivorans cellulosilyticus]|uniref:Transcription antitermination protein NusB n=1 Tax=Marinagarivorans cellulosilyticus TaxID=2721545 RepID=A0AAN2BIH9_9GAMM|nr:transcription antitermination factor NusB [Marinagarivorans cellulosilyticus]BCD96015.1 transcription antitermination protein NusB [Marinagarivorans cellulosilyticus]